MDAVAKRYSSPFLVDTFISSYQFDVFVNDFWKSYRQDKADRELWEFFLTKVHDKSFKEFKEELTAMTQTANANPKDIVERTKKSAWARFNKEV